MSSPRSDFALSECDVREIVRLLGDVIATRGDINVCRRKLVEGLCSMVGADSWIWCMADVDPGKPIGHSGILHGGFDDAQLSGFLQAINHPSTAESSRRMTDEVALHGRHLTKNLPQIEDPAFPMFGPKTSGQWKKAGIGTMMLSMRPINGGGVSGIGLYRKEGKIDFDEREVRIAHIVLTEISWLHYTAFPDKKTIDRLYPRHRTVLNLLCEGWDRKKIASHLGISPQTVHGYVKEIFRNFGVHSQPELIAKLGKGDGGDR